MGRFKAVDRYGTPVAANRIDLSWTASTDTIGVAGYNVYRDAVKVNTVPIGSTSYSDTGLVAGASHTYTVRAVDAAANESSASTSWSGAAGSEPSPPPTPTTPRTA
jgi:fibronectin type 3 domain-containing protein